jgi:hypothetical protein
MVENGVDVPRLESKIRDFINNPRKQHILLKDSTDWNQLCSSMDALGDTSATIDAYLNSQHS